MKKLKLEEKDLTKWMQEEFTLYASQYIAGGLLRLELNSVAEIKITHGAKELYRGASRAVALAFWNAVV